MIATVGLLTPQGLEQFYAVFEDYEHLSDVDREPKLYLNRDILRFSENSNFREWEKKRKAQYRSWLSEVCSFQNRMGQPQAHHDSAASPDIHNETSQEPSTRSQSRPSEFGTLLGH